MNIKWNIYRSIYEIDSSLWKSKIEIEYPFISIDFIKVIEKTYPKDQFYYFIGKNKIDKIIAIGFYYISKYNLLQSYSKNKFLQKIYNFYPSFMKINIGMNATWQTQGSHIWFDEKYLDYKTFSAEFIKIIKYTSKNHFIMVWRDYEENLIDQNYLNQNKKLGFLNIDSLSSSKIFLKKEFAQSSYFEKIKSKQRVYIRKIIKDRQKENLKIEIINDFSYLIDFIYPLYLNVYFKAKEYQSPLLPKSFFRFIKAKYNTKSKILVLKDHKNQILAFVLLLENKKILNPFLIGMDYSKKQYNLWYNCIWECIIYGIKENFSIIDLGVTNLLMKKKLGATEIKNKISIRFRNDLINFLFKKLLIVFSK